MAWGAWGLAAGGWGWGEGREREPPVCLPLPVSPDGPESLHSRQLRAGTQGLCTRESLAPTQEEPFVLTHIQFINNEMGTGIYLFMIAFKSPIRSYIHFSCQFAKNLLKVLLM